MKFFIPIWLSLLFFVVSFLFSILGFCAYRYNKNKERRKKAVILHNDMVNKYEELTSDPFINDKKLKEWLPIFDLADRICATDYPDKNLEPIADSIREMLSQKESADSDDK